MVSYPQVKWARCEKRGIGGRVVDFTEDGRLRDHMGRGIVIWKIIVSDCNGVSLCYAGMSLFIDCVIRL